MRPSDRWWRYRCHALNDRIEVCCRASDEHRFWLSNRELASWTVCAHCAGWVSHWPQQATGAG
jgi:hypothetical protein